MHVNFTADTVAYKHNYKVFGMLANTSLYSNTLYRALGLKMKMRKL